MRLKYSVLLSVALALAAICAQAQAKRPHNIIVFVADGLRSGIVTPQTAPAIAALRAEGVDFQNSHSLYPTITTVNASAIATGHYVGDTGDFGNTLYVGPRKMGAVTPAVTAALEDDAALAEMNARYGGNYLGETSLLAAARAQGWSTASVGKRGPAAIQDVTQRDGLGTIVIDDGTGRLSPPDALPVAPDIAAAIRAAGLAAAAPTRGANGEAGAFDKPGARVANITQQDWFTGVVAQVLLPRFKAAHKPFALVFWSRDPDGTQHNQGDSLGQLSPGINGPTTMAALRNVSGDLQRIRDALKALGLERDTDIVVTADHGFSTASKESRTSAAAKLSYRDTRKGFLPNGFLAIDLSLALKAPLWTADGRPIDPKAGGHPRGPALIGPNPERPELVVASNGGTDLIYLTGSDPKSMARRLVPRLTAQDYTGTLFVNDDLGSIPGALPMSMINLKGSSLTPRPSIMVGFANRAGDCARPDTCQIDIADTDLQQGQGQHGTFGRGDTHNFMAAVGPDFKAGFLDPTPVSNADLAQTLAAATGLKLSTRGSLTGRVISEALKGGAKTPFKAKVVHSPKASDGFETVLDYQEAGGRRYFDAAGMPGRVFGVAP